MLSFLVGRVGGDALGRGRDRAVLVASLGAVVVAAWMTLALWGASPGSRYHGHGMPAHGTGATEAALFVGGWLLMIVAMMLPTTWPLLATFQALVRLRRRPGLLVGLVGAGYLVTWLVVGVVLHVGDRLVHAAVDAVPFLAAHSGLIAGGTVLFAGVYQFLPIKYECLDECRSPLGFLLSHWRGVSERSEAFAIGIRHGLFCVGCWWSLMLVMFAVGTGSLAWMLVLGTVMAIEKNASWGRRLSAPLGIVLISVGGALTVAALAAPAGGM